MVTKNAISLEQLLLSRDRRVEHQRELLEKFSGASLICFTVMLPGPVKRDWRSLIIADAGVVAIRQSFSDSSSVMPDLIGHLNSISDYQLLT